MKTLMAFDSWALTKKKLKFAVAAYKRQYPEDYKIVCKGIAMKRSLKRDEYATIEGSDMRGLFEIPEDLHTAFVQALDEEEIVWFKTKEGGRWFARTFPEFSLPDRGSV